MFFVACLGVLLSLPPVRADGWDDFSNNLATDIAPLLSLFGEQITKQYLSESITVLDYVIFAMAPMGILTAVVSAIRVCGSPSLRAFIGRAQEGGGNAEAELCPSISRNSTTTAELPECLDVPRSSRLSTTRPWITLATRNIQTSRVC